MKCVCVGGGNEGQSCNEGSTRLSPLGLPATPSAIPPHPHHPPTRSHRHRVARDAEAEEHRLCHVLGGDGALAGCVCVRMGGGGGGGGRRRGGRGRGASLWPRAHIDIHPPTHPPTHPPASPTHRACRSCRPCRCGKRCRGQCQSPGISVWGCAGVVVREWVCGHNAGVAVVPHPPPPPPTPAPAPAHPLSPSLPWRAGSRSSSCQSRAARTVGGANEQRAGVIARGGRASATSPLLPSSPPPPSIHQPTNPPTLEAA